MISLTPTTAKLNAIASPGLRGLERNWLGNEATLEFPAWNGLNQLSGIQSGKSYQPAGHLSLEQDLAPAFRLFIQLPNQSMIAAPIRGVVMPNLTRSQRLRYQTT
ncbi:MAG: hypothetical protein ACPGVO_08885 [Spirulinaceae cyanobacterium]